MQKLSTLIAVYRATLKPSRKWSSSKDYLITIIDRELGSWRISSLTAQRLFTWAMASPIAPKTKYALLSTLGDIMKCGQLLWDLRLNRHAPRDAIAKMQLAGLDMRSTPRDRRVSKSELMSICENWEGRPSPHALWILRDTAMRAGELCALHWRDVDLKNRMIVLQRRKGHKVPHRIPLIGDINRWHLLPTHPSGRVLPYSRSTISDNFRVAAGHAQVRDIRLHDLRHEAISRMADSGWSTSQMQAISGHRTLANLNRYTHITPEKLLDLPLH